MFTKHGPPRACVVALSALVLSAWGAGADQSVKRNDTVTLDGSAQNDPPLVYTNGDQWVPRRAQVTLFAWGWDPENDPMTITWEQTEGPPVTLTNANTFTPSFVAPEDATRLRFEVRASDGTQTSAPAAVVVDVQNYAPYVGPVTLSPNAPRTTDDLVVDAYQVDPDNDALTTTYEWRRNGTLIAAQTSATFPASLTTKNDVIVARVSVSDGFETTTAEATTTILDSPPVLTAQPQPPTTLNYGDTAHFTVTASDADGDPVDLEVAHGPAGFSIDNSGEVTWTAAGPLFDRVTDFNWGVRVRGDAASLMTGSFEVTDANRLYPLSRGPIRIPGLHGGLQIGDFDGNGSPEILVAGTRGLYELRNNGASYQQSWAYPFEVDPTDIYTNEMHAVAARDLNGDGRQEIFFSKGSVLVKLDGVGRREMARTSHSCLGLEFADLEADGHVELVCLEGRYKWDPTQLTVLDPANLAVLWSTSTMELGNSMAVGNVDGDPALEIVTAGGYVYDGQSRQNEWTHTQPFGVAVDTGDLDGNGVEEIVGIVDWTAVRVYSAVAHLPLWEYVPASNDLDAVHVADANSDGRVEAIVANGQRGYVMGIGYNTTQQQLELQWQVASQDSGVTSIAVGNVDSDSAPEVVWGVGWNSSGRDDFVIAGFSPAASVEWQSTSQPTADGPFYGGALARIGAGETRLMFMTPKTESSYGGMRAIALDSAAGTLAYSRDIGSNWLTSRAIDLVDYDNDGVDELFLGTSVFRQGHFCVYDIATDTIEWESPQVPRNESPLVATHADVNGDGYQDLIGLTSAGYIYVYDVHARALLWKSTALGGLGTDIVAADLDDDGESEIVVATSTRIVLYGKSLLGAAFVERASQQVNYVVDLLVSDLDGDNELEIYGLHSDVGTLATLHVYDNSLQPVRSLPLGVPASTLFTEESSFRRKNLLIGTGSDSQPGSVELWAIDPVSAAEVWRSPLLMGRISLNSLRYVDADQDGDQEISFGTTHSMYLTR